MPSPLAGELLVEVRTAGVNPVDWKIRSGMMGPASPSDLPAVLGSEVSGVVREVGQDVEGFAVNDEVFGSVAPGSGGYAEYTLVTASAAAHKPPRFPSTTPRATGGRGHRLRRRDPAGSQRGADPVDQRRQRWSRRRSGPDRQRRQHQRHRDSERRQAGAGGIAGRHLGAYGDGVADRIKELCQTESTRSSTWRAVTD